MCVSDNIITESLCDIFITIKAGLFSLIASVLS
jgi:hypothetical protein